MPMENRFPLLNQRRVLVIDGDAALRAEFAARLADAGAEVRTADSCVAARPTLNSEDFDLVLCDDVMAAVAGVDFLETAHRPGSTPTFVVMMAADSTTRDAIRAIKAGAADYLMKPVDLDELLFVSERAIENVLLLGELRRARERGGFGVEQIVGESPATAELRRVVKRVAKSGARTMLITGPSGAGKEVVARAIHNASPKTDRPFLDITCAGVSEAQLERALFGRERGDATDGRSLERGLLELANGGTVFLDEIDGMPSTLQTRLLRFLESKSFRRVGGERDIEVDVRVITATRRRLTELIEQGIFFGDLYDRLNVIPIEIRPLAQRQEDLLPLVTWFLHQFARELNKDAREFDEDARGLLERHTWPGNVRELRSCIERAVMLSRGATLGVETLPPEILRYEDADNPAGDARPFTLPVRGVVIDDVTKSLLNQALIRTEGNKSRAALLLGIHRDQVRYWVKKFGLERWIRRRGPRIAASGDFA